MKKFLFILYISLLAFASTAVANDPPEPQAWDWVPTESVTVGEAVNIDLSTTFSDPDGDNNDLTYHLTDWSAPLPEGLVLDENNGMITGTLLSMDDVVAALDYYAEDLDGGRSFDQSISLWTTLDHVPVTSMYARECDPSTYMCMGGQGFEYNREGLSRGFCF